MFDKPCNECGKIHSKDELKVKEFVSYICENSFPKVWSIAKEETSHMSRQELAKELYFLGFFHAVMLGGSDHESSSSRSEK